MRIEPEQMERYAFSDLIRLYHHPIQMMKIALHSC